MYYKVPIVETKQRSADCKVWHWCAIAAYNFELRQSVETIVDKENYNYIEVAQLFLSIELCKYYVVFVWVEVILIPVQRCKHAVKSLFHGPPRSADCKVWYLLRNCRVQLWKVLCRLCVEVISWIYTCSTPQTFRQMPVPWPPKRLLDAAAHGTPK